MSFRLSTDKLTKLIYLPINLDITKMRILVIGGGKVAWQKIKMLLQFTQNITVIAPDILPEIQKSKVTMIKDIFKYEYLNSADLVYACTNDKKINTQIKQSAKAMGLLVNVADNPKLCDFITPAIFIKQEMTVAVSSNGKNLKKTIEWRNKIAKFLQND